MTGRGRGVCSGYSGTSQTFAGRGGGAGGGRAGWGGGWRHRNWFHATGLPGWQRGMNPGSAQPYPYPLQALPSLSKEQELALLKQQADNLFRALHDVQTRLRDLEPAKETPSAT